MMRITVVAEMIIKVKEPVEPEYALVKKGQILYTYFHFASSEVLTKKMIESGAVCLAYETVELADHSLPLLIPMSEDLITQEDITGELGDIILGRIGGRTSEEEITVMKTVGFATLDVVTAWEIYLKAKEAGVGSEVIL